MGAITEQSAVCPSCGSARLPGARFCTTCGRSFVPRAPNGTAGRRRFQFSRTQNGGDLLYITIAAILAVAISHLPVVNVLIYPFKLFGTFVHEWCHALVALATGGTVVQLQVNGDLSGETFTRGGVPVLIWSAGYTGAAIVGACLLLAPTRFANRTLVALGAVSLLMPLLAGLSFGTSFPADTWLWALIFGVVSLAMGIWSGQRAARVFQQFVAVELCVTAIDSLRDLIWLSTNTPRVQTDAYFTANYTHTPALLWSLLWCAIAVLAIGLSVFRVVRRSLA